MTTTEFLARFDRSTKTGDQWLVRCPAHADSKASLAVRRGSDGRTVLHCHAGCDAAAIVASMNLSIADLFERTTTTIPRKTIVQEYSYCDESGHELYQVVRFEPKDFRQRRRGPTGEWIWKLDDVRRVVYRLPDLQNREAVLIVEGEKDAEAAWDLELRATTNVSGAGKWRREYSQQLQACGVKRVKVIADNDTAGREHAQAVAQSCFEVGIEASIVNLPGVPEKGDLSDYLKTHSKAELIAVLRAAPTYEPTAAAENERGPDVAIVTTLADVKPEKVRWLFPGCLAVGKFTMLAGDPGLGKTYLATDLVARVTTGNAWPDGTPASVTGDVIMLAAEDGVADTLRPRLDGCGADVSRVHLLEAIRLEGGGQRGVSLDVDLPNLERVIRERKAVMVVIDPVSSYLGEVKSGDDIEVRRRLTPIVEMAKRTGVVVLGLMHLNKNTKAAALHRGMASMAFFTVPRCVVVVGPDPDERDGSAPGAARVLVPLKYNISAPMTPLGYRIAAEGDWGRFQ